MTFQEEREIKTKERKNEVIMKGSLAIDSDSIENLSVFLVRAREHL